MPNKCEHCGARMVEYKHNLSRGLVVSLMQFAIFSRGKEEVSLQDVGLANNSYANFQKLGYHGLVEKGSESGFWKLTEKGKQFLSKETAVYKSVITYRKVVKEFIGDLVYITDILKDSDSDYWQKEFAV